jgi:hypothetical protein
MVDLRFLPKILVFDEGVDAAQIPGAEQENDVRFDMLDEN